VYCCQYGCGLFTGCSLTKRCAVFVVLMNTAFLTNISFTWFVWVQCFSVCLLFLALLTLGSVLIARLLILCLRTCQSNGCVHDWLCLFTPFHLGPCSALPDFTHKLIIPPLANVNVTSLGLALPSAVSHGVTPWISSLSPLPYYTLHNNFLDSHFGEGVTCAALNPLVTPLILRRYLFNV